MGKYDGTAIDYASVLQAVPQPIAVCGAEGQVLFLNATARRFLGVEEGDSLPRFALADRETFSQVRIDTTSHIKEYFLADVDVDGAELQRASMSLSPIEGDRYRVILEAAPTAMVAPVLDELDALVAICDGRRRIRLANAALNRLLGELGANESDRDLLELFVDDDRALLRIAASEALAGNPPEEQVARLAPGCLPGGESTARVRIRPLRKEESDGGRGFLMVAQPTEASFTELQKKLARAEELMSLGELATGVAHELKNPLTSILNYAAYLKTKYHGQFFEQDDGERLQRIIDGVERIDRFVRDLLNLAEADELERAPTNLHDTLRATARLNQRTLQDHEVELVWELQAPEPVINAHLGGLKQVFGNLVLNAARAMPEEGGTITVRSRQSGDCIEVDIEDTARGIPDEIQARIFEPFYSASPEGEGAGLGLALVRRLVEQHGGEITVDSTVGEGTCFTVRFPF